MKLKIKNGDLTDEEIPGLEEIKKACKSHRIERIEKNESEAVIELKRKQKQHFAEE